MEGPPGSGKTATLCELVHQLTRRGKRVLFCASTHIAVDNLLEKIAAGYTEKRTDSNIIPIRIGRSEKISPSIAGFMYDNFAKTIKKKITDHLERIPVRNAQQKILYEQLRSDSTVGMIARDCANLVCGTTIGILQHPDIKNPETDTMFDVMIIDEASKTTFQEFLVPALYASRWIIAGDTRQLAPHTSQEEIKPHVDKCISRHVGQACCDAFLAHRNRIPVMVATDNEYAKKAYEQQCRKLGVDFHDADAESPKLPYKGITLGAGRSFAVLDKKFPQSAVDRRMVVRGCDAVIGELVDSDADRAKLHWWEKLRADDGGRPGEDHEWGAQMTWRVMSDPARGSGARSAHEKIKGDIEKLMPADEAQKRKVDAGLAKIKKIALPSILQLLQYGYGPNENTIMTRGIPKAEFEKRHVLLEWQHRMHPEIAEFPSFHVYGGSALRTPKTVKGGRDWQYGRYSGRSVWIHVKGGGRYTSAAEAEIISAEIQKFYEFACKNERGEGRPWDVAVLTFYTKQRQAILDRFARTPNIAGRDPFCMRHREKSVVTISCQTLDSFQGHEADVVFLSIASDRPTVFLENPNRVNVAITRARYQNVIVGDRDAMRRSNSLLGSLAEKTRMHEGGPQ